jgi:hypothetical protein
MDWVISDVIASLALAVSMASAYFSYRTHRRSIEAERPICWLEVLPTTIQDAFLATVNFENRTPYPIRVSKLSVPIVEFPIGRKQDFVILDYSSVLAPDQYGNAAISADKINTAERHLAMPMSKTIAARDSGRFHAVLVRGALSGAQKASINLQTEVLGNSSSYRSFKLEARLPGGITIKLG